MVISVRPRSAPRLGALAHVRYAMSYKTVWKWPNNNIIYPVRDTIIKLYGTTVVYKIVFRDPLIYLRGSIYRPLFIVFILCYHQRLYLKIAFMDFWCSSMKWDVFMITIRWKEKKNTVGNGLSLGIFNNNLNIGILQLILKKNVERNLSAK